MTAQEMKALSAEGEIKASRVDAILTKCREAAANGEYSIYWYNTLTRQAKTKLCSLGYTVDVHDDQRDSYVHISWN